MQVQTKKSLTKQRKLALERLENRMLMNGDPAPLVPVLQAIDVDDVAALSELRLSNGRPPLIFITDEVGQSSHGQIESLPAWLVDEIDARHGAHFGTTQTTQGPWIVPWYGSGTIDLFFDADLTLPFQRAITNGVADSSDTNVQVQGVDEADRVETDGEYIYIASDNELVIVDARGTANLSIASRIQLTNRPTGMYLDGDRLTLLSAGNKTDSNTPVALPFWSGNGLFAIDVASYGIYQNFLHTTEVTVLDVADRSAPTMVQKTQLDGRLVDSRMVDGELRIVLQQNSLHLSDYLPQINQSSAFDEATGIWTTTYESRDSYLRRANQALSEINVPGYQTLSVSGDVLHREAFVKLEDFQRKDQSLRGTATTIATFDSHSDVAGPTATKTLITTSPAQLYATTDSIYLFGQQDHYGNDSKSKIWKFDFGAEDAPITLAATGSISGNVQNQFSADEYDGYLRVVTTTGWGSDQQLSILGQKGNQLVLMGSIDSLAPGERLHSVRFMGDRAFVVTFRKVDPLFSIDLSNPKKPTVEGELKIPGFSDYLQPLDENHLLGIGRGASESMGLFQELQLSIFDVTDLSDPQLAHRYSFGGGRSTASIVTGDRWSVGDGDHHAFSYFAEQQVLAVPIYNADQFDGFWAGIDNSPLLAHAEGGLQVFRVDVTSGFQETALIEHDSRIFRSLRINNQLIAVSAGTVTVHDLLDPTQGIDELDLGVGSDVGLVELAAYQPIASGDLQGIAAFAGSPWGRRLQKEIAEEIEETEEIKEGSSFGTRAHGQPDAHEAVLARELVFSSLSVSELAFSAELDSALLAKEFAALVG